MLPAAIGSFVPGDHQAWNAFLDLLKIMDILLAPLITQDELAYVQVLMEHHLQDIKEVYPGISIIPKMHYLVHMPCIALKFGPLARLWTMRYEAKNKYFKSLVSSGKNFVNLPYTLCTKPVKTSRTYSVSLTHFLNALGVTTLHLHAKQQDTNIKRRTRKWPQIYICVATVRTYAAKLISETHENLVKYIYSNL